MALEFIHWQKRRQNTPWDHVLLVAAVTMSLFSAVDSSRCHCELQYSVCCADINACEADRCVRGQTDREPEGTTEKSVPCQTGNSRPSHYGCMSTVTPRNGPSYSCSQQLLPPTKRLCFHRCPSVGWLVCKQDHDHTKTAEQNSMKLAWSMGLSPEQTPLYFGVDPGIVSNFLKHCQTATFS